MSILKIFSTDKGYIFICALLLILIAFKISDAISDHKQNTDKVKSYQHQKSTTKQTAKQLPAHTNVVQNTNFSYDMSNTKATQGRTNTTNSIKFKPYPERATCFRPPTQTLNLQSLDNLMSYADTPVYFNLNGDFSAFPPTFQVELRAKLTNIFYYLNSMIASDEINKVFLNMTFFYSRRDYEGYLDSMEVDHENTQGIYLPAKNHFYIEVKNDQQAMRTALHESVHAIIFAYFGHIPRFLEEGLASTLSDIDYSTPIIRDTFLHKMLTKESIGNVLDFETLTTSYPEWFPYDFQQLYLSSHSWVHFLLNHDELNDSIAKYLQYKHLNPCSKASIQHFKGFLNSSESNYEQEHYYWQQEFVEQ